MQLFIYLNSFNTGRKFTKDTHFRLIRKQESLFFSTEYDFIIDKQWNFNMTIENEYVNKLNELYDNYQFHKDLKETLE